VFPPTTVVGKIPKDDADADIAARDTALEPARALIEFVRNDGMVVRRKTKNRQT